MRCLTSLVITISGFLVMTNIAYGFDSQGHRGARGLLPENTLAGFARALSIGVNTLELDVGVTYDDIVVITHNPRLEPETTRDSGGNWLDKTGPAIRSLSLEKLQTYDVGRLKPGTRYQNRFPNQVAVDGARIPTLKELIHLVKQTGNDSVQLNIETKLKPTEPELYPSPDKFISVLLKTLRDQDFLDRVTIQSFDWRALQETQQMDQNIPTSYLTIQHGSFDTIHLGKPGPSPWTAGFDIDKFDGNVPEMVKAAGGRVWSSHHRDVSIQNIKQAHDLGLEVKVWTVNDTDDMKKLIEMGVDGIITDYPDRLRKVLKKLAMTLPRQSPVSPE